MRSSSSSRLRLRAHAKVNLALRVGPPPADGYHRLATVFQTVSLHDLLLARRLEADPGCQAVAPGVPVGLGVEGATLPADNTVARAATLMAEYLRAGGGVPLPPLGLHLVKRVPLGAGLGGGSSDAVAALAACARLWRPDEPLPLAAIEAMAADIGADAPFFAHGGTALGRGRGDRVEPLEELPCRWLVLAAPRLQVSTAAAYAAFDEYQEPGAGGSPSRGAEPSLGVSAPPGAAPPADTPSDAAPPAGKPRDPEPPAYTPRLDPAWMGNDLAAAVAERWPAVEAARQALLETGAEVAQMSGSGAASFGAFPDRRAASGAAALLRAQGLWATACHTVNRRQHLATQWPPGKREP